jgi:hypothetical protein
LAGIIAHLSLQGRDIVALGRAHAKDAKGAKDAKKMTFLLSGLCSLGVLGVSFFSGQELSYPAAIIRPYV